MRRQENHRVDRRSRKKSSILPGVCIVLAAGVLAFAGAVVWNGGLPEMPGFVAGESSTSSERASDSSASESSQSSSQPETSGTGESSSQPESGSPSVPQQSGAESSQASGGDSKWYVEGSVPESERVSSSYFDDAMFIGDSLTYGILSYEMMENTTVVASVGINLDTIETREVYRNKAGEMVTIMEGIRDYPDMNKIYVMLGANGIAWLGKETFIDLYTSVLDTIIEEFPDATIYVQSMLPVTKAKETEDDSFANSKIDEYNLAIRDLALEKGCYYVNVAEAFKDDEGCLPAEASPTDGMHFGPAYYQKWFDYLKTHTVS